jgi:hypothetical protein
MITQTVCLQPVTSTQTQKSGERGIRTPGPVSGTQHFQCCTIGHSATSPDDPIGSGLSHHPARHSIRAGGSR